MLTNVARHHRTAAGRGAPDATGQPRCADRAAEPGAAALPAGAAARGAAPAQHVRSAVPRPGLLQAGQRPDRARERRPAAARGWRVDSSRRWRQATWWPRLGGGRVRHPAEHPPARCRRSGLRHADRGRQECGPRPAAAASSSRRRSCAATRPCTSPAASASRCIRRTASTAGRAAAQRRARHARRQGRRASLLAALRAQPERAGPTRPPGCAWTCARRWSAASSWCTTSRRWRSATGHNRGSRGAAAMETGPGVGLLRPGEFLQGALEAGLTEAIDRWVLQQGLPGRRRLAGVRAATHPPRPINLSPRILDSGQALDLVTETLASTGLDPTLLELELTEGDLVEDLDAAAAMLGSLRPARCGSRDRRFRHGLFVAELREELSGRPAQDRPVLRARTSKPRARTPPIVHAIITLGHSLGLSIVAEGVETVGQLTMLMSDGWRRDPGATISANRCRAASSRKSCAGNRRWRGP